jgi:hypothetical protein
MPAFVNHSPFVAKTFAILDPYGQLFDVILVSATFEAPPGKALRLADQQSPLRDSDEHYGDPGLSSVRFEGEVAWEKPSVDVIVNGTAYAPRSRKTERVLVSMRVGDLCKELQVSGDRFWRPGLLGIAPSAPQPFEMMPIVYERAFGGIDTRPSFGNMHHSDPRNPIGVGFQRATPQDPDIKTEVPNVEYPSQLLGNPKDRPLPAGFAVIGRNWEPRISFAGTYDDAWKANQFPLLPLNFDVRHFQAAPSDQQSLIIRGGESVEILNMTPEGTWQFFLPTLDVTAHFWSSDRSGSASLKLDTVLIEPDYYRVTLLARAKLLVVRNRAPLEEIIIGHMTPAWKRARLRKKNYFDKAGRQGRMAHANYFRV